MKSWLKETLSNLFSQKFNKEPKKDGDKNDKAIAKEPLKYIPLTPIELETEGAKHYINALNWAIDNKDIRNIALTGTYGSGKSSILKTFEKANKEENNKFLNISLANFSETRIKSINDKKNSENTNIDIQTGKLEEQIFLQLHYSIGNDKLPNSRFRKINNSDILLDDKFIINFLLYLTCFLNVFQPKWLLDAIKTRLYINTNPPYFLLGFVFLLSCIIASVGMFKFLRWLFKSFSGFQRVKVKFLETEIESSSDSKSSFLSQHLDEVLYFFEKTKINIVIFEDLDRFENTEIFIKLRELNTLINGYELINKPVKFIYAIKDDIFLSKDRTKFFEFIVPVIPVMNASNSYEVLCKEFKGYGIDDELLSNISLFIEDRRLLNNIVNEFLVYKSVINASLNPNKLLALLVYKNLFPSNFEQLINRDESSKLFLLFKDYNGAGKKIEDEETFDFIEIIFTKNHPSPSRLSLSLRNEIDILTVLISNGYLGSDYLDYVITFYPGRISFEDNQFLIDIKAHRKADLNHKLNNPYLINEKLSVREFGTLSVENVSLIGHIIKSEKSTDIAKGTIFFNKIFSEPDNYSEFLIEMLISEYAGTFVHYISYKWSDFWSYFYNLGKAKYLNLVYDLILQHSSTTDILKFTNLNYFKSKLQADENLFSRLSIDIDRAQDLLKSLDLKFSNLDLLTEPTDIVEYIYEESYYQINIVMLERLFDFHSIELDSFYTSNYHSISSSGLSELYAYISKNINEYIEHVYLKLPYNIQEDEGCIMGLFDFKISDEVAEKIITRWSNKFDNINVTITKDLRKPISLALEQGKVSATWHNVLLCFEDKSMNNSLVNFLNSESAIDDLINNLEKYKSSLIEINQDFIDFCVSEVTFNIDLCVKLLKALDYKIEKIYLHIGYERVKSFIENSLYLYAWNNLTTLQYDNEIRYLNLSYIYIDLDLDFFIRNSFIQDFDSYDFEGIVRINFYNYERLNLFLRFIPLNLLNENESLYLLVQELFFKFYIFDGGYEIASKLLSDGKGKVEDRLKLFNYYFRLINLSELSIIFEKLGPGFDEILHPSNKPLVPNFGVESEYFTNNLKELQLISNAKPEKDKIRLYKKVKSNP